MSATLEDKKPQVKNKNFDPIKAELEFDMADMPKIGTNDVDIFATVGGFKAHSNETIKNKLSRSKDELMTNIPSKTLDILTDFTTSNDTIIITRPINDSSFHYIAEGAAGKDIFVHAKSGPSSTIAQGLIPIRSSISKAGKDDNVDKIKKYNSENAFSISRSKEKFTEIESKLKGIVSDRSHKGLPEIDTQALLKEAKIPHEAFDMIIGTVPLHDKHGNQIYIFEDEKGRAGKDFLSKEHIYAIKNGDKFQRIDLNHKIIDEDLYVESKFKPIAVEVIGKPQIEIEKDGSLKVKKVNPITADIDVLAYGAKVNLQEFDKIVSHSSILEKEKRDMIENSSLHNLPDKTKDILANNEIDKVLNSNLIPRDIENKPEFKKLVGELKHTEALRENLRGMGEGSETILAITGHMRESFKDKAISHSSEQFNLNFTQPMDNEWVLIDNKGKVSLIEGEDKLVETFNKYKKEGFSIPPNPNWGWKINNGEYEIDPTLKAISKECDNLHLHGADSDLQQKQEISAILKLQTKIGIEAISEKQDEANIKKETAELESMLKHYNKKHLATEHRKDIVHKIDNETTLEMGPAKKQEHKGHTRVASTEIFTEELKSAVDKIKETLSKQQGQRYHQHTARISRVAQNKNNIRGR